MGGLSHHGAGGTRRLSLSRFSKSIGLMCRNGEIFVNSQEGKSLAPLADRPSSAEGSPANPTALQENVRRLVTAVISPENSSVLFGKLNPDGSCLKTSQGSAQASLGGSLESSSMIFPKWGIVSDGVAGELLTLEPAIKEREFLLLPTLTSRDYKDTGKNTNYKKVAAKGKLPGKIVVTTGLKLQPAFAEWMMGFPEGWTELDASEMLSSRNKRTRSSKQSRILKVP